ncbi:MAG TPA: HD family phosphohydrolase [Ruminococcaceae bacterium]|nr:HD family phosphohydrolase [Oscillospiraceae bacterium]
MERIDLVLQKMAAYNGNDVKRINHALKVYAYAQMMSGTFPFSERKILLIAAILHDIGIHNAEKKYHSSAGKYQEIEGPPVVRALLKDMNLEENSIARVCYLVGHHHHYMQVEGEDYQVLIEADLLVNIEEEGLSYQAVQKIGQKHFKTQVGRKLLHRLFLFKEE